MARTVQVSQPGGAEVLEIVEVAEQAPAATEVLIEEDLAAAVQRVTDGRGASVALDPVGGALTGALLEALAPGGRLIVYGDLTGEPVQTPALPLVAKRLILQGFSLSPAANMKTS